MQKQILLITGMHRSGTSMLARLLNLHGVYLPFVSDYKNEFNERGYWESFAIQRINDDLFRLGDSSWFDVRKFSLARQSDEQIKSVKKKIQESVKQILEVDHQIVALKDPRICRLLPIWCEALETDETSVLAVTPYRNPLAVAASLNHRDGISLNAGLSLWLRNVLDAEFDTRHLKRVFCSYEEMLTDWSASFSKISHQLELQPLLSYSDVKDQVNEFVSGSLKHWSFSDSDLKKHVGKSSLIYQAYQLLQHADQNDSASTRAQFDVIREEFERTLPISRELKNLAADTARSSKVISLEGKLKDAEHDIADLNNSFESLTNRIELLSDELVGIKRAGEQEDKKIELLTDKLAQLKELHREREKEKQANLEQIGHLESVVRQMSGRQYNLEAQLAHMTVEYNNVLSSLSWRLTNPVRYCMDILTSGPLVLLRSMGSKFVSKKTRSNHREKTDSQDYVPLLADMPISNLPVQLIAFYLPQFHAIPENNEWWGEGFTEWSNVKPAKPYYAGHYQPRLPGELGYYDLTDKAIQQRQVELAKLYGVGGFCFYFYWFAGKRLLETPTLNYLESPDLDLPFCLCWANENWTRTWDGLEKDVLIAQDYSTEDDLAFIEYISKYLRDDRYIKVDGKPLLIVYRPNLLPSPFKTAKRWRTWCRDSGIGEIFLATTQSFEISDPREYGFDAAIEFPPNNTAPDVITDNIPSLNKGFSGIVYDWNSIAERSFNYEEPNFPLFRTVNPSWDNTARKKTDGAIFYGNSPKRYEDWLVNAALDAINRAESDSQKLVFVNAWNEWAEGAYLEPDSKHGYAYLQATRNALAKVSAGTREEKIVLVVHDALAHGAQYLTLYLAQALHSVFGFKVDMVVLGDGMLLPEFERWANVHSLAGLDPGGTEAVQLAQKLYAKGNRAAIANTTVSGAYIESLTSAGIRCISLVHELRKIIDDYGLHEQASVIAQRAEWIVFAAPQVADSFLQVASVPEEKVVIRPQGLYKKNAYRNDKSRARYLLRKELGLPKETQVVLGVGYLDHRKGVDLFVDAALHVIDSGTDVYFVWVGHWESSMKALIEAKLSAATSSAKILFVGRKDDTDMYYAGADVFVLSSREDPFPSTVMESLEVGVPVVGFKDAGGIATLLEKGCGMLVPFEDTNGLAAAIMELLTHPDLARKLGDSGAATIAQDFSFRHYVYDLLDLAGLPRQRISVVVPNFNYARHLKQRLNSIFSQTYPIFELIVLDDASEDNSLEVIENALSKTAIDYKLIVNDKNSGSVFEQWRKAIELAQGDFIWICEADDFAEPDFLEKCISKFDDPEVVLSYSQSMQVDEDGTVLNADYLDYTNDISESRWQQDYTCEGVEELTHALAVKNSIPNVSAVIFRKTSIQTALKRCGTQLKKLKIAGDWLIYSDMLQHGRIAFCPESLNAHRRHDNSVTIDSANNNRHMAEIIFMQKRISEIVKLDQETVAKAKGFERHASLHLGLTEPGECSEDPAKLADVRKWLDQISS